MSVGKPISQAATGRGQVSVTRGILVLHRTKIASHADPSWGLKEENALFALEILYMPGRRILLAANSLKLPLLLPEDQFLAKAREAARRSEQLPAW